MKKETLNRLFGKNGTAFIPTIKHITSTLKPYEYKFLEEKKFIELFKVNQSKGHKIYWQKIIMRAHFSAITTLLRSEQWLDGAIISYESSNYLAFTATFRGFLESSVDSFDSLSRVLIPLAENFEKIEEIITENNMLNEMLIVEELENILIHYSHGRKINKGENSPNTHKAKTMTSYILSLESENSNKIKECYSELCQLTHPAAQSVFSFTEILDSESGNFTLSQNNDKVNIENFCNKHKNIFDSLFQAQFNASLIILRIINLFTIKEFETISVNDINFENIKAWKEIEQYLPR